MIDIVELKDCIFQLKLLLKIRKRIKNEFPPLTKIDCYEKATALLDEAIDPYIVQLDEMVSKAEDEYELR